MTPVTFLRAASLVALLILSTRPLRADPIASDPAAPSASQPAASEPTSPPPSSSQASVSATAAPPSGADSNESPPPGPGLRTLDNTVSVFGVLGYGYSGIGSAPGVGARYQKTIVRGVSLHGPKLHDDIGFEGGVDFVHYSWSIPGYPQYDWSFNEISALAGLVWNVWIGDNLALYPKLELAYGFGSTSSYAGIASPSYGGLWFQGAAGVAYKLGPIALRGEAGWRALRLGAGYSF